MTTRVEDSVVIAFGHGGNSAAFAREGWHGCEAEHRWSAGVRSVLVLPPLAASERYLLTFDCDPVPAEGVRQSLGLEFNGVALAVAPPQQSLPQTLIVPGEIVSPARENVLVLHSPNALIPAEHFPGNGDTRVIAFAWRRLEMTPDDTPLIGEPLALPEADPDAMPMQAVASLYQSLGQNCEVGLFQRRCGVEPMGLLRFASIYPDQLVLGLRTRFAGVGIAENLTLKAGHPGGELNGHQVAPKFMYHTFKNEPDVDVADFQVKETRRLGYLARLFVEQLENDEKIFVRRGGFEADGEIWALHRLLRTFNPQARLLMVQASPERAGRVEQLSPNVYRGFLANFADPVRAQSTLPFEGWRKICATLYAEQQRIGRVDERV